MAFDYSFWLFDDSITTIGAAEATLQGVKGYTRLVPTASPAGAQVSLYLRARQLQVPEWMPLVTGNFNLATWNQNLTAAGFQGFVAGQAQVSGLVMILIIETGGRVFAVTAGSGIGLLDREVLVAYAGKDAYLNQADDGDLSEVSAGSGGKGGKTVTVRSNSKSTTDAFPKGDGLRVVKKVAGETTLGTQKVEVTCAHQLRTSGSVNLADVVQKCNEFLAAYLNRGQRKAELATLAPTEPVKGQTRIEQLDRQLHAQLVSSATLDLAFVPPSVDFEAPYTYELFYQTAKGKPIINAGTISSWNEVSMRNILRQALSTPWHLRAAEIRITGPTRSRDVEFIRCISFQGMPQGNQRLILDDGVWHEVQLTYIQELDRDLKIMLGRWQPPTGLPQMSLTTHTNEAGYNSMTAAALGYVCLDKAQARPIFHGSPLELCDMFAPDGSLYVAKIGVDAAKVVYVADQALSALSALSRSASYWDHYVTSQGVTYSHDPMTEPHKFRWVITLISNNTAPLPSQLMYKAKRALVDFDAKARADWKFETGLVHVLQVP